ncbi:hypothetical protein MCAG_00336 [Micromonospora sp. ATCC 39149]|uniref:DUF2726 domain-containing protein n=1 Tax=Micromonospora carbonacea TaxID=47853 RepID=A0A7D5YFM6_9ACTN|nr:DUF2726 domain-containing protein [Micromonospora sp. ATCC 39149]EEP70009.1 hypothetical protein MCAG_00336 [Micromonospora sp. ATCC 39149]QLJ96454.1 DUF2726 domain-containing protein [Micromonospora carbonacea]
MTRTGSDHGSLLRPVAASAGRAPVLTRAGQVVYAARRLGELVYGRPPGVTGHQWNSAGREGFDHVVCAGDSGRPLFAVEVGPPAPTGSAAQRAERMKDAVCAAVGLPVLRVASPTLRAADHGRRIVEYVIDARAYADAVSPEPGQNDPGDVAPVRFREIVGRLPDGRSGHVNDLGALARAAAVEAYVSRRLVDPIVRGLHVCWTSGPVEGWSWVEVLPGRCLVERVEVIQKRFSCGVDAGRLAEDLAAVAVGERLRGIEAAGPELVAREELDRDIRGLRQRRDEMRGGFAYDHLCAG